MMTKNISLNFVISFSNLKKISIYLLFTQYNRHEKKISMKKIKLIVEGKSVRQDMYINRVESSKTLLNFPPFYLANEEKFKKTYTYFDFF